MEFYDSITSSNNRSPLRKVSANGERSTPPRSSKRSKILYTTISSTSKESVAVKPAEASSTKSASKDTNTSNLDQDIKAATNPVPQNAAPNASTSLEKPEVLAKIDLPRRLPSRQLVQLVYENALTTSNSDQTPKMTDAGLLSLQDVLIPSLAQHELKALKKLQSKLQRDAPLQAQQVALLRKATYDCLGDAAQAVEESRKARRADDEKREQEWEQQRALQDQRTQERLRQERELARAQRKTELVKKHPQNQALWREVVYLMTEMSKLEKEERLWKQAQENLQTRQAELEKLEEQKQQQNQEEEMPSLSNTSDSPDSCPELQQLSQTIQEMTISSNRIQQALDVVADIATESDKVRQELYRKYRRDFQFHGYAGVQDPKGLLRSLSQSQDL